ncbi:hypothetical protein [Culicoidibacter larvae]|uniref:Uncharacterized protein n=1 Tax=Culicoidibacter larvae TaxID=2579976 RepID=A0A5R8QG21_9FIRM|nr:hypothetical protein [Culicoidibacter larvae]TLG76734.1 hypothetical protein FEZ08_03720 [Culicoidibacter larvae]
MNIFLIFIINCGALLLLGGAYYVFVSIDNDDVRAQLAGADSSKRKQIKNIEFILLCGCLFMMTGSVCLAFILS